MFTIVSIMSQSSHDATPGLRLPPLKERLKDLLKIYISYYRKLLLTPDSITELLENGIFKSDDIKHGAHNVAHIVISLSFNVMFFSILPTVLAKSREKKANASPSNFYTTSRQ